VFTTISILLRIHLGFFSSAPQQPNYHQERRTMNSRKFRATGLAILLCTVLASASFASTSVTASVVPFKVAPGTPVFVHTSVSNSNATPGPVTVTIKVTGPCTTIPANVGALAFSLRANETRFADLSLNVPPTACFGTYTITVTVKNTITGVTFTKTATFTVGAP
jgi:hypothetical protein